MGEEWISQTDRPRCVVDGKRTGGKDKGRCTLVAQRLPDGTIALFPHGAEKLEVQLPAGEARKLGLFLARTDEAA